MKVDDFPIQKRVILDSFVSLLEGKLVNISPIVAVFLWRYFGKKISLVFVSSSIENIVKQKTQNTMVSG